MPYARSRRAMLMPEVLDWQHAANPRAVIDRAVQALVEGQLVALPTETVYGLAACALVPEAVERLQQSKGRPENKPLTLALRGALDALDWVPDMSPLGRRLARRCWPGPVTLVFDDGIDQGLASRLPEAVRQRICPTGTIGLRVPAHEVVAHVLQLLPGPLVLTSANRSGEPAATTAQAVVEAVGDEVAVILDDGPSHFGQASTVVLVNGATWSVLREGVVSAADLERQTACVIVFVCTGNTCRSPLAEALCKKRLAERLGCSVDELPQRGFIVLSAGLAAMMGGGAAFEAIETAHELGADLSGHISRPLTPKLVSQADYLVAMTQGHVAALLGQFPQLEVQPRLLSPEGDDLADPVGCELSVYRACAQQILRHLEGLLPELQPS
jgi:tRNA threonylcarbamoyl adenosine modification protein (Sua5/YciO/YrdC/YwlC family)